MDKEFVCKFCNKKFPSGKSLGGHIRIHTPRSSDSFIGKQSNNKKRLVDQRELTATATQCRVCGKSFCSLKALANHMDCHNDDADEKMVMDTQSGPTMVKRSKKQPNSESFSIVSSSSDSEIDQGAKYLMMMSMGKKGQYLSVNSLVAESSENNSEILETKSSSGELLKTDTVAVDDDDSDNGSSDSYSSDSDYFINGPKKSDSDISFGGSLRKTGFNSFSNGDEIGVKKGGSKHELGKSKRVSPFYESDSSADTNSKILRSSDSKSMEVKKANGANKNSRGHVCPICFKVYSSGQALGGHKRSHSIANQQHRIKHKASDDTQIDLNLPAQDDDGD